jgi:hypothetical protein
MGKALLGKIGRQQETRFSFGKEGRLAGLDGANA